MSKVDDGGPAFPAPRFEYDEGGYGQKGGWIPQWDRAEGMTLRDYFAAKAMQTILLDYMKGSKEPPHDIVQTAADASYVIAEAMLKARQS